MLSLHKLMVPAALVLTTSLVPFAQASGSRDGVASRAPHQAAATSGELRIRNVVAEDLEGIRRHFRRLGLLTILEGQDLLVEWVHGKLYPVYPPKVALHAPTEPKPPWGG